MVLFYCASPYLSAFYLCVAPVGVTHAELVLSAASGERDTSGVGAVPPGGEDASGPKPPQLGCVDWARRGFLAERLGHTHVARSAYRVAAALGFSIAAYTALLRLEAAAGAVADTLMAAQQLLLWHDARAAALIGATAAAVAAGRGASSATLLQAAPQPIAWFLAELAGSMGAERVRAVLSEDGEQTHPLLLRELEAWDRQAALDMANS